MDEKPPEDFWSRLDRVILERGLSRNRVADMVNRLEEKEGRSKGVLNQTAFATWKNRRGFPELERLSSIAKVLGVKVEQLLFGEEEPVIARDFDAAETFRGSYSEFCHMRARQLRDFTYKDGHWEPLTPAVEIYGRIYKDHRSGRYKSALRQSSVAPGEAVEAKGLGPKPDSDELTAWCKDNAEWLEKLSRLPAVHQEELLSLIEFKFDNLDRYE